MSASAESTPQHQIDERFTIVEHFEGGISLTPRPEFIDPETGQNIIMQTPEGRARFEELDRNKQIVGSSH